MYLFLGCHIHFIICMILIKVDNLEMFLIGSHLLKEVMSKLFISD